MARSRTDFELDNFEGYVSIPVRNEPDSIQKASVDDGGLIIIESPRCDRTVASLNIRASVTEETARKAIN